jgi:hypothetical protein
VGKISEQNSSSDFVVWVDSIKKDEVVLSDGEYLFNLKVVNQKNSGVGLPDLFQKATINDQFKISVDLFGADL